VILLLGFPAICTSDFGSALAVSGTIPAIPVSVSFCLFFSDGN